MLGAGRDLVLGELGLRVVTVVSCGLRDYDYRPLCRLRAGRWVDWHGKSQITRSDCLEVTNKLTLAYIYIISTAVRPGPLGDASIAAERGVRARPPVPHLPGRQA